MRDNPDTPAPHSDDHPDDAAGLEATLDKIRAVASWYRQEIFRERHSGAPDPARLEELLAGLRRCAADEQALQQAGAEEAAQLAASYQARYEALTKE